MKTGLLERLSQHSPVIILILSLAVLVLFVIVLRVSAHLSAIRNVWKSLSAGVSGPNLEALLNDHLRERMALEAQVRRQASEIQELQGKMATTKRHLGLVRFDAFEDIGGAQSFALAIYDDQGDGAVISSLLGRSECRVYGKTMSRGRTERNLSQEESRAISEAQAHEPRPIVS